MTQLKHNQAILVSMRGDCELAMSLVDTLLEEQAALLKMQTEQLAGLSAKKEAQMFELEQHMTACAKAAELDGFEATSEGLLKWVDSLAVQTPELLSAYGTLRDTLSQAKRLNDLNAQIVNEQLMSIKDRLSILTAASTKQAEQAGNTYGPSSGFGGSKGGVSKPRVVIR